MIIERIAQVFERNYGYILGPGQASRRRTRIAHQSCIFRVCTRGRDSIAGGGMPDQNECCQYQQ